MVAMRIWDSVVVGTGPAGVAAAEALRGSDVLLLEAGGDARDRTHTSSADYTDDLLKIAPKLRGSDFEDLRSGESVAFIGLEHERSIGLAMSPGGYSTAWGAQLFPFNQRDLDALGDWPISADDLAEAYRWFLSSTNFVGGGESTEPFFGLKGHQDAEPLPLNRLSRDMLARHYGRSDGPLRLEPALVALNRNRESPGFYGSVGEEFGTFSPRGMTTALNRLEAILPDIEVSYRTRVTHFEESRQHVDVHVNKADFGPQVIRTRKLFLALGTIATARIVLERSQQLGRAVPFVEHSPQLLPLFDLFGGNGRQGSERTFPVMVNGYLDTPFGDAMVAVYNPSSAPVKTIANELGVSQASLARFGKSALQRIAVAQIWTQTSWDGRSTMVVDKFGVRVRSLYQVAHPVVALAAKEFRKLGYLAFRYLSKSLGPGWGFHWAGTLPMRENPREFETFPDGRLWNSQRVFSVDGSVLPSLPSKNHSLTIMANAYRVAKATR